MSKNYTAITKKGRGTHDPTALCCPVLSAPKSRWGQKWVRGRKQRKYDIDDSDSWFLHPPISRYNKSLDFVLKIEAFVVEEGGFEPPKASPADLQSVPFGHSGTPPYSVSGAGGRIRTPDLLITNRFRYKNPGISKAFRPFFLRNQQLVHAVCSTVSTRKYRPVGQLVGQPTFHAESGLDDSDNSPKEGQKSDSMIA